MRLDKCNCRAPVIFLWKPSAGQHQGKTTEIGRGKEVLRAAKIISDFFDLLRIEPSYL